MEPLFELSFSAGKTFIVLCAVASIACIDIVRRIKHRPSHLFFAAVLGTTLSIGLIRTVSLFLQPGLQENPYAMALALILTVIGWKALFGPWEPQTKLAMLATFLFWISLHLFWDDTPREHLLRAIAAATALVPAAIWCKLFLKYHRERLSSVMLLFLAGTLSTVPILFYDALVRRGVEMQFFFFTIKPESFSQTSHSFISGQLAPGMNASSLVLTTLLSFIFVGLIEEVSKYWVVSRSARQLFTSIDDAMQLSIIVAIGFAFAENIINPVYFMGFVSQFLMSGSVDIGGFLGNVLGRSVLTSMVHIVSTGVMGYFLGLSIFAGPYLAERHAQGHSYRLLSVLHHMLRLREVSIFRVQMLATGLFSAVTLHGLFNFMVTLPDIIPGKPTTVAELMGMSEQSILHAVPLLLIPALFYVVGGFWLLTTLFMRKENIEERGHLITQETIVKILPEEA
jgi:hypothetical protein